MNTYTAAEILGAVNAEILDRVEINGNEKKAEFAAQVLRSFLAKLGDGETI